MLCRTYYARLRGKVFFAKHFIILRNRYTNTNYTFFGWYVELNLNEIYKKVFNAGGAETRRRKDADIIKAKFRRLNLIITARKIFTFYLFLFAPLRLRVTSVKLM